MPLDQPFDPERLKEFREMLAKRAETEDLPYIPPSVAEIIESRKPAFVVPKEDLLDPIYEEREDDVDLDGLVERIGILPLYRKWIGKNVDEGTTKKREGVKVSCPKPDHRDEHPSAWLNQDKNTWYCGGCDEGGDIYDLAAIRHGYTRPDYKDSGTFPQLRQDMLTDLGYASMPTPTGDVVYRVESEENPQAEVETREVPPTREPAPLMPDNPPAPAQEPVVGENEEGKSSNVTLLVSGVDIDDEDEEEVQYPDFIWQNGVKKGTFLEAYMLEATKLQSPDAFSLFHGLVALGNAVGRNVYLLDGYKSYPNIFMVSMGSTGTGKSTARRFMDDVMRGALPYDDGGGMEPTGTLHVPTPGSGEVMVDSFQFHQYDASAPKGTVGKLMPVNGTVNFDEFASFTSRASRMGSTLKQTLQSFADCENVISTVSRTYGKSVAMQPFCTCTSSTQPRAIRDLLTKDDVYSGFINRWFFVGGNSKSGPMFGNNRDLPKADEPIRLLKTIKTWGAIERELKFDDDALAYCMRIERIIRNMKSKGDLYNRIDGHFKKLALLFAINDKAPAVYPEHAEAAWILTRFLVQCYSIVGVSITENSANSDSDYIENLIKKIYTDTGKWPSTTDIKNKRKKSISVREMGDIIKTLSVLGILEQETLKSPKGGRPTVRYKHVG